MFDGIYSMERGCNGRIMFLWCLPPAYELEYKKYMKKITKAMNYIGKPDTYKHRTYN